MKSRSRQDKRKTDFPPAPAHKPSGDNGFGDKASGNGWGLPCFSRSFDTATLLATGADVEIEANAQERAALADLDDLVGINRLIGRFHIAKHSNGLVNVRGHIEAEVTQICVISLDPFDTTIEAEVDVNFAEEGSTSAHMPSHGASHGPSHEAGEDQERDPPDLMMNGEIDLGALAAEFLALSLDPYPKKEGARFEEIISETPAAPSPFAILGKITQK